MPFSELMTNHRREPLGISTDHVVLSWNYEGRRTGQVFYRIQIAGDSVFSQMLLDTGWETLNPLGFTPEMVFYPRARYYWRVLVAGGGPEPEMSRVTWFEIDKGKQAWSGKWICAPFTEHPVFRKTFQSEFCNYSRLYLCGLGLYELYVNGKKVSDEVLLPGYHSYDMRIMYQTFDLEEYLVNGENVLEIMLAPGWYMGRFGFDSQENIYGDRMVLLAELHLEDEVLGSDNSWLCRKSPVLFSNIYDGEIYDASRENGDYDWQPAELLEAEQARALTAKLVSRTNNEIREIERLSPVEILHTPKGDTVLDFGQNLAGWFTFTCREAAGKKIELQAAEVMIDKEIFTENLRTAKAHFTYIADGQETRVRPHFTFFGFRYLKVEGIEDLLAADFEAVVLSSVGKRTGYLETGIPEVNRLIENSRWGQVGNFIDVPTDCPQRDERMGWTGDTQIYSGTACYNYDSAAFYAKFMEDVLLEQGQLKGSVPFVVPDPKIGMGGMHGDDPRAHGSCAWADVATVVPWNVYKFYGDKALLAKEYPSMTGWVDYITSQANEKQLWQSGFHFADWLALDNPEPGPLGGTDPYYCASAYYYYSAKLTARAAKELGLFVDYKKYDSLARKIREAFGREYFTPNGLPTEDTQTACVIALQFGLCPDGKEEKVARHLHDLLAAKNMHLDTGFIGTGYLLQVLSDHGYHEDAVSLLLNRDYPSWLYPVSMGATTIWERWNSILPDGSMNPDGMNSLNHYAYGSVVEWMYRHLGGMIPMKPGFSKILFAPKADQRLGSIRGSYESASGTWKYSWYYQDSKCIYQLTVPFGCTALIRISGFKEELVGPGTYIFQ